MLTFSRGALVGLAAALVWHVADRAARRRLFLARRRDPRGRRLAPFLLIQLNPAQLQTGLNASENVASTT